MHVDERDVCVCVCGCMCLLCVCNARLGSKRKLVCACVCVFSMLPWFSRHFFSVDKSAAPDRNMGYLQVPDSTLADVYVYMHMFRIRTWWISSDSSVTLAQWTKVRYLTAVWVIRRSTVQFRPKPQKLKSMWIWDNRPTSNGFSCYKSK